MRILPQKPSTRWNIGIARKTLLAIFILATPFLVWANAVPQTHLVIEAGAAGGRYDKMAHRLSDDVAKYGLQLEVVNRSDSAFIIDDISNPDSSVKLGFISGQTSDETFDHVKQIAAVSNNGFLIVANKKFQKIEDLKNSSKIGTYPDGSSTQTACNAIFSQFDIDLKSRISLKGTPTVFYEALAEGTIDAFCEVLPASNPLLESVLVDSPVHILEIPHYGKINADLPYMEPLTIPIGTFSIQPIIPSKPVDSYGLSNILVAKEGLDNYSLTAISEALKAEYSEKSLFAPAFTYPNNQISTLPSFPRAVFVTQNGPPWMYRQIHPFVLAGFIDNFLTNLGSILAILFTILGLTDLIFKYFDSNSRRGYIFRFADFFTLRVLKRKREVGDK